LEGNKKNKKPHILLKICLCLLLIIVVAVAALAVWQRDNINAFIRAQNTTQEDIAQEISESKANTQKALEQYNIPVKRDFTLEEEEAIRKGTLSVEDAVKLIMSDSADDAEADSAQANGSTEASNGETGSTQASSGNTELTREQQIVADHLTQMYSLKAYYIGQLGVLEQDLKAQYKSANGDGKNAAAIAKVVQSNMGRVVSLESECDSKVDAILADMKSELEAIGADTSIVQVAEDSYINEKSLRKSYYLSLYN
jgi:hypothetical protein